MFYINNKVYLILNYKDSFLFESSDNVDVNILSRYLDNSSSIDDTLIKLTYDKFGISIIKDKIMPYDTKNNIYSYSLTDREYENISKEFILIKKDSLNMYNIIPLEYKTYLNDFVLKKEKSCGAIILKDSKVLIIKQTSGYWSFPKGHVENNEKEEDTALREVKEEVNLDIELDNIFREVITYCPNKINTLKDVVMFLGYPISEDIVLQEEEVLEYKWESLDNLKFLFKGNVIEEVIDKLIIYLND